MSDFDSLPVKIKTKLAAAGLSRLPNISDEMGWKFIIEQNFLALDEVLLIRDEIFTRSSQQANIRYFECVVHLKRQHHTVKHFSTYEQLLCKIQKGSKWSKMLLYYDFKISAKYSPTDKRELKPNDPLPFDLPKDLEIEMLNRRFSSWKSREEDAMSYVGSMFIKLDRITPVDTFISSDPPDSVDESYINKIVQQVRNEIEGRLEAINLNIPSELTCREFISPFLIGSIRIICQYLKAKNLNCMLSLVDDKFICGLQASGPVDYVIVLDYLNIVLTQTKNEITHDGIIQNLLQQHASLEYLANIMVESNVTGSERKKRFREEYDNIRLTFPTYGIVSNGTEWIFTKCIRRAGQRTEILRSNPICINYAPHLDLETLLPVIRRILFIISNIMVEQIRLTQAHELLKTFKDITPLQLIKLETNESKRIREEERAIDDDIDENTDTNEEF